MAEDTTNSYQPLVTLSKETLALRQANAKISSLGFPFHIQIPLSVGIWCQGEATFRAPSTCLHDTSRPHHIHAWPPVTSPSS